MVHRNVWDKVYEATGAKFIVVGSKADDEVMQITASKPGIVFKGFVSDEELEKLYSESRIVAVPLRYGAGVKGKVVEALHYGCPIVTTSVGAEGIEGAEEVMAIADEPAAFAARLTELYKDTDALREMSIKASGYSDSHNSVDAAWQIIKGDFQ